MIPDEKYARWQVLAKELADIKKQEMELRVEICTELLEDKPVGTHHFESDLFNVTAIKNVNIKLGRDELDSVWEELSPEELECVDWQPKLRLKEYKALPADQRAKLDTAVIVTPGAPTLKVF